MMIHVILQCFLTLMIRTMITDHHNEDLQDCCQDATNDVVYGN